MATALRVVADQSAAVARPRKRGPKAKPLAWPALGQIRLAEADQNLRRECIGGSDANIILSGEPDRVLRLWREKRGEEQPEDLSAVLPVMLGSWTEAFNRQWYERQTGQGVSLVGHAYTSPEHGWRRCTLDGYVDAENAVFEAKHVNAFSRPEEVLARYMPQLQHNMAVMGFELALLSVIFGNHKWEVYEIAADWLYQDQLFAAEERFWACVQSGARPVAVEPPPVPRPSATRELCFEGNNAWATAAADWLETKVAAKRHVDAGASIKDQMEADVVRAFGHGIEAKRSKSGAVTIKELGQ
jgi:predicted phage-related endonuclease